MFKCFSLLCLDGDIDIVPVYHSHISANTCKFLCAFYYRLFPDICHTSVIFTVTFDVFIFTIIFCLQKPLVSMITCHFFPLHIYSLHLMIHSELYLSNTQLCLSLTSIFCLNIFFLLRIALLCGHQISSYLDWLPFTLCLASQKKFWNLYHFKLFSLTYFCSSTCKWVQSNEEPSCLKQEKKSKKIRNSRKKCNSR